MIQFGEYTTGWLVYIVAILGLLLVTWRILRPIPWRYLRHSLWLTVAVLFLTPAIGSDNYWAPAWVIGALTALFEGVENIYPILRIVTIIWLSTLLAYTLLSLVFGRSKKPTSRPVNQKVSPQSSKRKIEPSLS